MSLRIGVSRLGVLQEPLKNGDVDGSLALSVALGTLGTVADVADVVVEIASVLVESVDVINITLAHCLGDLQREGTVVLGVCSRRSGCNAVCKVKVGDKSESGSCYLIGACSCIIGEGPVNAVAEGGDSFKLAIGKTTPLICAVMISAVGIGSDIECKDSGIGSASILLDSKSDYRLSLVTGEDDIVSCILTVSNCKSDLLICISVEVIHVDGNALTCSLIIEADILRSGGEVRIIFFAGNAGITVKGSL